MNDQQTQSAQRVARSAPPLGSTTKVIVYAGQHYGKPHYVVGRHTNERELIVWHVEDSPGKAFRVNVCDTETLSPNAELRHSADSAASQPKKTNNEH